VKRIANAHIAAARYGLRAGARAKKIPAVPTENGGSVDIRGVKRGKLAMGYRTLVVRLCRELVNRYHIVMSEQLLLGNHFSG